MARPAEAKTPSYQIARLSTMQQQVEVSESFPPKMRGDITKKINELIAMFTRVQGALMKDT